MNTRHAVIGAGWAGLAAALELTRRGHPVDLLEASRTLGGRARQVEINGMALDNGQHILLGAYRSTLGLLEQLGQTGLLQRQRLEMCYPATSDGMQLVAAPLPAPFHMLVGLLRARGLTLDDKLALARFSTTARWMDWQLNQDCTVAELLQRYDQTDNLVRLMWQPLCVAALNTPIDRASAQVFLNVLRDSLGAGRAASDMLIPRADLGRLLPEPAAVWLQSHGSRVLVGSTVNSITRHADGWQLEHSQGSATYQGVVIATPPPVARTLLTALGLETQIPVYDYEPITTCYLQYPAGLRLERAMLALIEATSQQHFAQYVFDRGQLDGAPGLLALVISASRQAIETDQDKLAALCAAQLAAQLRQPDLLTPLWSKVITEKRATFACTPGLARPANQLPLAGLVLAGDYTESPYPATLEAAVRSGQRAATLLAERAAT